jgi:hypothetical protein
LVFRVSLNKSLECDSLYDSNHKFYKLEMRLYVVGSILLSFSLGRNHFNPRYTELATVPHDTRDWLLRLARDTRERKDARQNTRDRSARDTRDQEVRATHAMDSDGPG